MAVFAWCQVRRIEPALSSVLATLVVFLSYRVGLIRYQMVLFFLIAYWAISQRPRLEQRPLLFSTLAAYGIWVALSDVAMVVRIVIQPPSMIVETLVSIMNKGWSSVTFLLGSALLASLIKFSSREERES
jgi:hypothetical protein